MKKILLFLLLTVFSVTLVAQTETIRKNLIYNGYVNFAGAVKIGGVTITASGAQLNYSNTLTSNVQTQLNYEIRVAASDATTAEKAIANYVCDGTNDEVQWALANTVAAGGVVKLLGRSFYIEDDITLTSHLEGIGAGYATSGTLITLSDNKQITLHAPGNLTNCFVWCATRSNMTPAVKLEAIQASAVYEWQFDLLSGLRIQNDDAGKGVGLMIYCNSSTNLRYIAYCHFGFIDVKAFKTNVSIKTNYGVTNTPFINSNVFEGFNLASADSMLVLNSVLNKGEITQNIFKAVTMQCTGITDVGIYISDNWRNWQNSFLMVNGMDWTSVYTMQLGTTVNQIYARGIIPVVDYGTANIGGRDNDIQTIGEAPLKTNTDVTLVGNAGTLTGQSGVTYVEGEGGVSDLFNEMYGVKVGQVYIIKRKTAGHIITITTNVGIPYNLPLTQDDDYAVLLGVSAAHVMLLGTNVSGHISGALTDGAPTDTELDTTTGLTPATAGVGYHVVIKDSDGSGLLYGVESDGSYWYYYVITKAL